MKLVSVHPSSHVLERYAPPEGGREGGRFFLLPFQPFVARCQRKRKKWVPRTQFCLPELIIYHFPRFGAPHLCFTGREGKKERKEGKSQLEGEERPPETKRIVEWTRHLPTSPGYQHRCGTTTMVHPFSPSLLPPLLLILNGHSSSMGARWKPASDRQGLFDKQKSEFLKVQEPAG